MPLVTGVSFVKWHLPHSISSEHRGRTAKCPIANHRVEYNYSKVVPVRIGIDKNNNLVECPIEFEILQEFSSSGPSSAGGAAAVVGGGTEKVHLGVVRINLSEYVEESEALLRSSRRPSVTGSDLGRPLTATSTAASAHSRKRSSLSLSGSAAGAESLYSNSGASRLAPSIAGDDTLKPLSATTTATTLPDVEDGVIRRHLMQDSKINSTLKVGILMVQVDGERNYVAPPLKTAPVFGGIAGLMASGEAAGSLESGPELPSAAQGGNGDGAGPEPLGMAGKSRDIYEAQDMYRRALAASWACQPGEMPADECIEDIFSGGDGFRNSSSSSTKGKQQHQAPSRSGGGIDSADSPPKRDNTGGRCDCSRNDNNNNNNTPPGKSPASSASGSDDLNGTIRPHHLARLRNHFRRTSGEKATTAFPAFKGDAAAGPPAADATGNGNGSPPLSRRRGHRREESREERPPSQSGSLASLATTLGSNDRARDRDGFRRPREVRESEVRDDMVAWTTGSVAT